MDELFRELNRLNELAAVQNNYAKTLVLLRALKAGRVTLDQVTLTSDGWQVAAILAEPAAPSAEPAAEPAPAADPPAEA